MTESRQTQIETKPPNTPLSETLLDAAILGSFALGAVGCAAEFLNSPNPRQDAIQSLKKFAIGCGLGLLAYPAQIAIHDVLKRIFPPDVTKTQEGQNYSELTVSPSSTIFVAPIIEELAFSKTVQRKIFYRALSYGMRLGCVA